MPDVTVMLPNHPERADFVQQWGRQYEKSYDLTVGRGQRDLVEAVTEMAKHVAMNSEEGSVSVEVGGDGVTRMVVSVRPRQ